MISVVLGFLLTGSAPVFAVPSHGSSITLHATSPLQVTITESTTPGNANINENLTANATGGVPPYAYLWNGGWTGPGPVAAYLIFPGNFTYTVVASDATGTTAVAFYRLNVSAPGHVGNSFVFSAAVASYAPTTSGATVAFTSSYSGNSAPVQEVDWDFGDGGVSYALNPTHQFNATGEYRVIATARTNANYTGGGTSAVYDLDVLVQVGGKFVLASSYYLSTPSSNGTVFGDTYRLNGAAVGGTPPYRYQWSLGDGYGTPLQSNASVNHTFWATTFRTYVATLSVTDSNGTSWNSVVAVHVTPPAHGGSSSPPGLGRPLIPPTGPLLFSGAVAAAAVAAALVVRRRRRARRGLRKSLARGEPSSNATTGTKADTRASLDESSGAPAHADAGGQVGVAPRESDLLADVL